MLHDAFNRQINYLRLAITDKCNLRCRYCMPEEGISFLSRKDSLSVDHIIRLGHIMADLGITKVRLTGGEPFIHPSIYRILDEFNPLFHTLNLTTNGTRLPDNVQILQKYKIGSINLSMDSLSRENFFRITKRDYFPKVWKNFRNLVNAGIKVKLNAVIMKGINDHEIPDFLQIARNESVDVRFIEAMPFNGYDGNKDYFMPFDEIYTSIKNTEPGVQKIEDKMPKSASVRFRVEGFMGNIGIIPAYSRLLCGSCNRIRITAQGELLTCLYSESGVSLKRLLDAGISSGALKAEIIRHTLKKEKDGFEAEKLRENSIQSKSMTSIGG